MAHSFNQEVADQQCAVYNNERQPLHLQDSLRHTDAQRLKAYHVSCLEATDANAAGRVSASWMHVAHLRSSGPMPPADDRFELYASNVLSAALGSISRRHSADSSPAAQALEALRVPGVLDYVAVQVAAAIAAFAAGDRGTALAASSSRKQHSLSRCRRSTRRPGRQPSGTARGIARTAVWCTAASSCSPDARLASPLAAQ